MSKMKRRQILFIIGYRINNINFKYKIQDNEIQLSEFIISWIIKYCLEFNMGTTYTKDQAIDLYIGTNKQFYIPGEYVEGEVYLNAKTFREYSNICLRIQGQEHVYWTTGSGKNRRTHSNTYKSMVEHRLLVDFHGKVNQGQYQFPFSILLPLMMNGSFYFSQNCYIKYVLRVELVHMSDEKKTQRFQMQLNILQPLRTQMGALTVSSSTNSQCCCCKDYGTTTVNLNCSKNFVYNGESIGISGSINNSGGKAEIQSWKIALQQRRTMISSGGAIRHPVDQEYLLTNNVGTVAAGATKDFNFNAVIPASITNYTAIGRVTARYFIIKVSTEYGCCATNASAVLHIIVHSRTPMIVLKKQIPPPPNWNPQLFPKIVWNELKPFVYSPLPQIPYLNMPGHQNVINQNQNQGYGQTGQMGQMDHNQTENYFNNQIPMNQMNQMNQMQGQNYQMDYTNYQPVYYNQNIFPELEQQWQGYGQQPYFVNQTTQDNLVRKL